MPHTDSALRGPLIHPAVPYLTIPAPQGHAGGAPRTVDALVGSAFGQLDKRGSLRLVIDLVDPAAALCLVRSGENCKTTVEGGGVQLEK